MAEIKKIIKSSPLSDFRQVAPEAGGAFRVLADAANQAYEFLKPAAIASMTEKGAELGREIAKRQIGDPKGTFTTSRMAGDFNSKLGMSEGGGRYDVVNSEGYTGLYQWGQDRLDDYNRASGTAYTLDQFKNDPGLQEKAQDWSNANHDAALSDLVGASVNGQEMTIDALRAVAHLGGQGGARKYVETNGAYNPSDSNGTSLSDYAAKFGGASVTSTMDAAPTMLREADGSLTGRLYSPLSGEILQAHNAAAGVAYQSEIMLKSAQDMIALSSQFELNPDGFKEAADSYVREVAKAAPAQFRQDILASATKEAQRRYLGMIEEKQRDTRQRANNSSAALVDRWSDNLAQAVAGGNPEEVSAAQAELNSILAARESLPGVAWTNEQSQNVVIKAFEAAQKLTKDRIDGQVKSWKSDLSTIVSAAKNGQTGQDEQILNDPNVRNRLPDEWAEAAAMVALRDNLPTFHKLTPDEQSAALADMKSQPVSEKWEIDLFKAAESAASANAKAWDDDAIKRAGEVLGWPLPPLINFNPEDPASAADAMVKRRQYALRLEAMGYVDSAVFLSNAEAEDLGKLMGKDTPPELRALISSVIVQGFGDDAAAVFKEIKSDDPTTKYAGMLMARGGDKAVAFEAMRGQAMLDEGLVQAPPFSSSLEAISPEISVALSATPINQQGELRKFAVSIYAARSRGVTDAEEQKAIMQSAVQAALGQSTDKRGRLTGGVQTVASQPVLLPPGVSGEAASWALGSAFSGDNSGVTIADMAKDTFLSGMTFGILGGGSEAARGAPVAEYWKTASRDGSMPMIGGKPISGRLFQNGNVRFVPTSGTSYRIEIVTNGSVTDARTASGGIFEFDMGKLIEAVPRQRAKKPSQSISEIGISP